MGAYFGGTPQGTLGLSNELGANVLKSTVTDRWSPDNTDAKYSRLIYGDPAFNEAQHILPNDKYVFDSSYLRMRNIQLSYSLPKRLVENFLADKVTVSVAGSNIWTLTSWPGQDPETVGMGPVQRSVNQPIYPLTKSYTIGLNIQF